MASVKDQLGNPDYSTRLPRSVAPVAAPQPREERQQAHDSEPLRSNRGVHEVQAPEFIELVIGDDGELKRLLKRSTKKHEVFLDWVNFTVCCNGFIRSKKGLGIFTDDEIATVISRDLEKIFGFGISEKRDRGMYFHKDGYVIGEDYGFFLIGHKNNRFMVQLSGEAWVNAAPDAAQKLYDYLRNLDSFGANVRLSRVDLASDYYDGIITHEAFKEAYLAGDFVKQERHRNTPECFPSYQIMGCIYTQRGLDSGITHAIGSRSGDSYLRLYDKGRQLGDKTSPWQRLEIEFKSKDTILPLDILINPSHYFAQYPFIEKLHKSDCTRFETKRKRAEITVDSAIAVMQTQFGKYIRVIRGVFENDSEFLNKIQSVSHEWPKKLARLSPQGFTPLHKQEDHSSSLVVFAP